MRTMAITAALLTAGWLGTTARAGTSADNQPSPPPRLCVNNKCASTNPQSASTGKIKWNPGHYMASNTVLYAGRTISNIQREMDDLNNQDAVLGYRLYITWGALEPSMDNYDFAVLDSVISRLKTAYNKPKRVVVYMWLYGQTKLNSNDHRVIPTYIQQGSEYGASPTAGSYGWWGKNDNGTSSGMYAPAVYYAPVMDRLIALVQALGKHLDGDPLVEGIEFQENATIAQAASAFGADPHYSDAAWLTQLKRLLAATTAAFPHTNVIMDNSWFDRPPQGVDLQQWMLANRIAPGTADSWGQSSIEQYGMSHMSDGIQTLLGVSQYGGNTDLRAKTRPMLAVEGMDIATNYFRKYGGPWTPQDLIAAFNQTYQASHVFWTHLFGTEAVDMGSVPSAAVWGNLAKTLAANPLLHTSYPENYP